METITEEQYRKTYIDEIVNDINNVPVSYLRTLYALVHSFKENILKVDLNLPTTTDTNSLYNTENEYFDWDSLVENINQRRRNSNDELLNQTNNLILE